MPDFDERIATWRTDLSRQLGSDADLLSELECHLRDDIAHRVRHGETPDLAMDLAIASLGLPSELACEFAKSATWLPIYFVLGICALLFGLTLWALTQVGLTAEHGEPEWLMFGLVFAHFTRCFLLLAIGGLANCYAVQRIWRDLTFGQARAWNRTQLWLASGALAFTVLVYISICIAFTEGDESWMWNRATYASLLTASYLVILLLSILRVPTARTWLMFLGFAGTLLAGYVWIGFLAAQFYFVAILQLPCLFLALVPGGWLRRRMQTA